MSEPPLPPVLRLLFALLRVVGRALPAHRREEWLREWTAELWYDVERAGGVRPLRLARRVTGALPHALLLATYAWSTDMLFADLRYAVRSLRRRPGFSLLVVGTLALGIGACTAMFTIAWTVLLRPLPYDRPEALVFGYGAFSQNASAAISPPDFLDYRERTRAFASLAARTIGGRAVVTGDGDAERVSAVDVTSNFFSTLGVDPLVGRTFVDEEEEGAGHDVVILSYGLWQRRFAGAPGIVGSTIMIDGVARQVVGVMPPVLDRTLAVDLWRPLAFHTPEMSVRRFHFLRVIGRLAPGRTLDQAQADLDGIARDLEATYAGNATWTVRLVPLRDVVVGSVGPTLLILLGAVTLVLLIACANVASLLLARASARGGEMALRTALGASRLSLVRQLLTESVVLALAGAAAGMGVASALVSGVRATAGAMLPRAAELAVDVRMLLFATSVAVVTGILFGLAPALNATRRDVHAALGGTRTSGGRVTRRMRDALVVAQVAVSLVLLAGAGLLLRSIRELRSVDGGFTPDRVLTAQIGVPEARYATRDLQNRFWSDLMDRLANLPGVEAAGATTMLPLMGGGDTYYEVEGEPASGTTRRGALVNVVSPGYFEALSIPIVEGRAFDARESPGTAGTIIISNSMADRIFPSESAIGRRLIVDFGDPFPATVIGVAGDVLAFSLAGTAPDIMYFAHEQAGGFGRTFFNVVVRARTDAEALVPAVRAALRELDPDIPLAQPRTLDDVVNASMAGQRFTIRLLSSFAVLALLLATIGLYGVLAWVVAQRRRELGIRMALGASRRTVVRLVLRHALGIVAVGLALGIPAALAASRLLEAQLFRTPRTDPAVFASVTGLLLLTGLLAALLPAHRATRANPADTLRAEP